MSKKWIAAIPISSGILWGATGIFVRTLTEMGMNSLTVMFSRISLSAVILFFIILLYDKSLLKVKRRDFWIFAVAGLITTPGLTLCYNESINQLTLSLAAILLSISPIFVLLFAAFLFREKITLRKSVCVVLAILGCTMVSGIFEGTPEIRWSPLGIFIGLLSGFFYAMYTVFSRIAMDRGYHPLTVTFYCILLPSVAMIPFADWGSIGDILAQDPVKNGFLMLLHTLMASTLPYLLYTLALHYMEAGKASILASTEPVAAMIFGIFAYREIPSLLGITGFVITIAALVFLSLPEQQKQPVKKTSEAH